MKMYHVGAFVGKLGKDDPTAQAIAQILDWLCLCFACDPKSAHRRAGFVNRQVLEAVHLHTEELPFSPP